MPDSLEALSLTDKQALIRMKGVTKTFPGVVANDTVDFDLYPGEVHTLLGENGAGKTTLMNILHGLYQPDSGGIEVKGAPVRIRSPFDSLELGIGMVHQHFALVPTLTVIENIVLGFEDGIILDWKKAEQRLNRILEEFGLALALREKISNLSVGEQQRVEIAKTLYRGSEVLILDEPTSVLTPIETEDLFQTLSSLRKLNKAVVFITHKLWEAFAISDRVSILKLGQKVAEFSGEKLRQMGSEEAAKEILNVMFGEMPIPEPSLAAKTTPKETQLELREVVALNNRGLKALKKVSLKIRKGEIFGIAGVDGNGQKELAEVIGGQRKVVSGSVLLAGTEINHFGPRARLEMGISHITDDRMGEGCVLSMDLSENSILRLFHRLPFSKRKVIQNQAVDTYTEHMIEEFNVKATGPHIRIATMSGGNIQKFLLARELTSGPKVVVCNKPTQGLDAKTTHYIRERLQKESQDGASVLLISSDLDELLQYSDRIGVLYNGEILDVVDKNEATPKEIGKLMLGMRD